MEIINVKNLSFTYPDTDTPVLQDISFSLERGEFAVICGPTGCGKSTLLRMLKPELTPPGELKGSVSVNGKEPDASSAHRIGFVMQNPEQQIVTDKVWHELAFGPESTGMPPEEIALKIAEISSYFGINSWYDKNTSELSGGQKQLLNLAAVMIMQPEILILDEPSSMLDPIAAADFITVLRRLCDDFSLTVIITEHRTEDIMPVCTRLIAMENGRITASGTVSEVTEMLRGNPDFTGAMPASVRIAAGCGKTGQYPLTVREGRKYIEDNFGCSEQLPEKQRTEASENPAVEFCDAYFRYTRNSPDILKGMNLKISRGEIFCILGGNGAGKSTALAAAAGLVRCYSGTVKILGKNILKYRNQELYRNCIAMLPQDVQTVFLKDTVREELEECGDGISEFPADISRLYDRHPYDLSGGEQQLTALAKVLAAKPEILLLDEPVKGMDSGLRKTVISVLRLLKDRGVTVIAVTHDTEFAAECADRCALVFNGNVVSCGTPEKFFQSNSFFTTPVCRMTRGYFRNAITADDAVRACLLNQEGKNAPE